MAVQTINIKKLLLTWGPVIFENFMKDIIEIETPEDSWAVEFGADGKITRVNKCIDFAKFTVHLAQSSVTNDKLSAFWNADKITGASIFPFGFRDGSGSSFALADQAFILKPPTIAMGSTVKDRTWVFHTGDIIMNHGSN